MRRAAFGAGLLAAAVMLTACGSLPDALDQSLKSAISATATAALQTRLVAAGSSPTSLAATTYGDAITELDSAQQSVATLAPEPSQSSLRQSALIGIRQAIDAVLLAQTALNGGTNLAASGAGIRSALDELKALEKRVKP